MSLLPVGFGASGDDYTIDDSLRFRRSATAYLSRTPASAGNRRTWTWSGWVKRGALGTDRVIGVGGTGNQGYIGFVSESLYGIDYNGSTVYWNLITNAVFRDPSAWYHIIIVLDTTEGTSSNRVKYYVNGVQQTSFATASYPSLNYQGYYNDGNAQYIGRRGYDTAATFDGYLTEVNFIDGQALTPTDFGEFDDNGTWKPLAYTGTYGTNGFYLPMKPTTQASGFNTVLYSGTSATQSIDGMGFSPDFVWIKNRDDTYHHRLYDTVRGATKMLSSSQTASEQTKTGGLTSFDLDGFTVGNDGAENNSGDNFVAWGWDAGSGSPVSNTTGSIPSTVKANDSYGFSIVSYTGNGTAGATVGHGLSSAPKFLVTKSRSTGTYDWVCQHASLGGTKRIWLNLTSAANTSSGPWNNTDASASVVTLGNFAETNQNNDNFIMYCWAEVAGYSKIDSYTGTGVAGNAITGLGFQPAWLMIKDTTSTGSWEIIDTTRSPNYNAQGEYLFANLSSGTGGASAPLTFDSDGFTINSSDSDSNQSGQTYIYMAFANTADARFNFDASGNKNNWLPNNINSNAESESTYDLMKDTPSLVDENAGNFATLNPLQDSGTLSNANLRMTGTFDNYRGRKGTMQIPSSGKWYWEYNITVQNTGSGNWTVVGVCLNDKSLTGYPAGTGYIGYGERNDGRNINNEGTQVTASSNIDFSTGDVLQVAYDVDTSKFWFGRNNTWFDSSAGSTGNPSTGANATLTAAAKNWHPFLLHFTNNNTTDINFGQQPFKYTPPTGFKKLNTFNLPDSTIEDGSQYFAATTYTGNGSDPQSIGGLNFQPDMVWAKARSVGTSHVLTDAVRGATKTLYPDSTLAEATASLLTAFNSDGFDVSGGLNVASRTLVGWSWKANGSGVSNNVGSIPSTVSANTTAGFSIVSYTGTGATSSGVTIGHGLGATPDVVITKKRSGGTDYGWSTWHKDLGGNYGIWLDKTSARNNAMWDGYTNFSSTVFSPPDLLYGNENGATYINYLFAEVPGYSSFGSYTGNGSAGGPFVYTGFRPAFLVVKNAIVANSWRLWDNERPGYNLTNLYLSPDTAGAEGAINIDVDFLSNGFKIRNTNSSINGSGNNIIYMAFAENPFKNANAR